MTNLHHVTVTEDNAARNSKLGIYRVNCLWWSQQHNMSNGTIIMEGQGHDGDLVNVVVYNDGRISVRKNYSHFRDYGYFYSAQYDRYFKVYTMPNGVVTVWDESDKVVVYGASVDVAAAYLEGYGVFEVEHTDWVGRDNSHYDTPHDHSYDYAYDI